MNLKREIALAVGVLIAGGEAAATLVHDNTLNIVLAVAIAMAGAAGIRQGVSPVSDAPPGGGVSDGTLTEAEMAGPEPVVSPVVPAA